jgi:hypothetical protein
LKSSQSSHHFHHRVRLVQEFVKFALGLLVPMPGVLESFNLRLAEILADLLVGPPLSGSPSPARGDARPTLPGALKSRL